MVSTPEKPTDWVIYWVFDNGAAGPPTAAEVTAALRSRERYLATLSRRVVDVPGNVGNPYWVADPTPLSDRLRVSEEPISWPDTLDTIMESIVPGIDVRESAWRITVRTDVRGAPVGSGESANVSSGGSATVVFVQFSHAIIFGKQIEAMSQALFAPTPEPLYVTGLRPAVARPMPIRAGLLGLALWPYESVRWQVLQRRAARAVGRAGSSSARSGVRTRTVWSSDSVTGVPAIRALRLGLGWARTAEVTVTALALTAISLATERYLDEVGQSCPPDLAALVWAALDEGSRLRGVNRVVSVEGDLCSGVADPADRARAINAALKTACGPERELDLFYHVTTSVPFIAYNRTIRRVKGTDIGPRCDIAMSSVRQVDSGADWSLAGRPYSFNCHAGRIMPSHPHVGHAMVGRPDDLTMTFYAFPATLDIDRYTRLLSAAFADLAAAFSNSSSAADRSPADAEVPGRS